MEEKKHTKEPVEIKNLKINREVHAKLKSYCKENGLKIFAFVEKLILTNCRNIDNKDIYGED